MQKLRQRWVEAERRVIDHLATPEPTLALYRAKWRATASRLRTQARRLKEAVEYTAKTPTA